MSGGARRTAELDELMARAAAEAERWDRPDLAARLMGEARALSTTRSPVLICGPPRAGKSTLVDALLDVRACSGDMKQSTSTPIRVTWSGSPCASVARDGGPPTAIGLREASRHAAERPTSESPVAIEVGLPRRLLADGIDLIDTPGLSGGMSSARAAPLLLAASTAAVVIYVVDPSRELSALDAEFLRRVAHGGPQMVVALTKIDAYPEWRRLVRVDLDHLQALGLDLPVLPLSAPLRFTGLRLGDDGLLLESGYVRLVSYLRSGVLERAADARADRATRALRASLGGLVAHATSRRRELEQGARADVSEQLTSARAEAVRLQSSGARWHQALNDGMAELIAELELDLTVRVRDLRKVCTERLESGDPAASWRTFEPWLYERTNDALLGHFDRLRDSTGRLVRGVADSFGGESFDLQRAIGASIAPPDLSGTVVDAIQPTRTGRGDVTVHAARGASLGASITLGVGHGASLLGLTILSAGWALPATAAVTAIVLGRRMARTAKDVHLRSRREEATRAVAAYLNEAELLARTTSRSAVRRVHQQVRDHFTETAAQLQGAAAQRLREVEDLARAGEDERTSKLARLDADLRRLRPLVVAVDELVGKA